MGTLRHQWKFCGGRDSCRILYAVGSVAEGFAAEARFECLCTGDLADTGVSHILRWRPWRWNQQFRHNRRQLYSHYKCQLGYLRDIPFDSADSAVSLGNRAPVATRGISAD